MWVALTDPVQTSTALPSPQLTHRSTSAAALKSSLNDVWVTETVVSPCQAFPGEVVNVPTGAVLSPGTIAGRFTTRVFPSASLSVTVGR